MDRLNKEQKKASAAESGISLIIAGAGTGKTKTLIAKIKNVILDGIARPEEIVVLTFSRKAAGEIKERVEDEPDLKDCNIFAGTFHSFAYSLIRKHVSAFRKVSGYIKFPEILSDEEKQKFFYKKIKDRLDTFLGIPAGAVYEMYESLPSLNMKNYESLQSLNLIDEIRGLKNEFDSYKLENSLIEYEDMINYSISMFDSDENLRMDIQKRIRFLFLDEFQDTSDNNFELIMRITGTGNTNLFAVGDDWQSIYAFRQANIDYILRFKKYFPAAKIHRLVVNYRSRSEIVKASNKFIRINRKRTGKKLKSASGIGGTVSLYDCGGFIQEKELIMKLITCRLSRYEDIAVIYRNNWQGKIIRELLDSRGFESVQTMTIHASKGLEFDAVIIAGVSDTIIPNRNTDIEEERRLFYVAMTRAREALYIICHTHENGKRSLFADELRIKPSSDAADQDFLQS
jgi:DNA helicase-2/ATP-dependent DNA helicase PcrA